jgi:formylglycine-generating enzyme required for sulfatase activity
MLPDEYRWISAQFEPEGDARLLFAIAGKLESDGNLEAAATVYDRAFGLDPSAGDVRTARQRVLERLTAVEHGLVFRYVPEGVFVMGRVDGEPDEQPWRPVWLAPYWMSETPITWTTYCQLLGWSAPPEGMPPDLEAPERHNALFTMHNGNKLRLQYCEDRTTRARNWHSHAPGQLWQSGGRSQTSQELFGAPERDEPDAPWRYDTKPMIAVGWHEARDLGQHLSGRGFCYDLPTEAQWEKAARGGLIGAAHAWGNDPPSDENCDFDRFEAFSICPSRTFPPNGYGLYAMNGGVWEWTRDWYDRDYYRHAPHLDPEGPASGEEHVLRGGSWADCAEVVTVSYRMSRASGYWRSKENLWDHFAPNIGFRLCRMRMEPGKSSPAAPTS